MALTRDDILDKLDLEIESVDVPEWGGSVYVRGMTGTERDAFESSVVRQRGKGAQVNMANIRAKLAAQTICDKDGNRLFSDNDIKALGKKSAAALDRIFAVAQRLSGISDADVGDLAEEMKDNPFEDSASD